MFHVLHRDRTDPPGHRRRSGPFEDRQAAEAFVASLASASDRGVYVYTLRALGVLLLVHAASLLMNGAWRLA